MSAVLTAACQCGRSVTVPCPTLGDVDRAAAFGAIEALGFRWDDRFGYRCADWPGCSAISEEPRPATTGGTYHEILLAAVATTGLTMSAREVGAATGFGPGVAAELDLLAERGLIGKVGRRFFPLAWTRSA